MDINELEIGMEAAYSQTISDANIKSFAGISGDTNPVHLDDEFIKSTQFERRLAHGFMLVSFFSAIFGTRLPGAGCVYLSQQVKFLKPVYIGDTVVARVILIKINRRSGRLVFKTTCTVSDIEVLNGEAEIFLPPKQERL